MDTDTDTSVATELLRRYDADEINAGGVHAGYPTAWPEIKTSVRSDAGNICVRCLHPYTVGAHGTGEWSPCTKDCLHRGPIRYREVALTGDWRWKTIDLDAIGMTAGDAHFDAESDGSRVERFTVEAQWRILTVHHLDGDKTNCEWWNIPPLCQRCHLTIQGKVKMEREWPWEHSDWFKPYVAGYYADVRLGQRLTREETTARLGELLDLAPNSRPLFRAES